MKVDDITQSEATAGVLLPCQPCAPPRILVVDDEPAIRHVMTLSLVQSGYHVDAAEDGEAAWQALQAKHYDLLITDLMLPDLEGIRGCASAPSCQNLLPLTRCGTRSKTSCPRRP